MIKMTDTNKTELLAPAGTIECAKIAVNCGADAIYFAGKTFGARQNAGNFSDDEIFDISDYCHLRKVRTYVTVNTLCFDREYKELEKFIKTLTKAGTDGVIVQDLGVLDFIKNISPDIELHGSTQMTVHSAEGVKRLEKLGVSRVVLARELSFEEISSITKSVSAETEVFIHGAMCMSYSGQCLMSSVIGGRSGNRGRCAQPCRLEFSKKGENPKHYLSLKDMSYAEHIKELKDTGVASLKIEGRMKGPDYVASVVSAYRRLIDEDRAPTPSELNDLNSVFFRGGLTDGYYTGKTGKTMFAFFKPDNPYLRNTVKPTFPDNIQTEVSASAEFKIGELPRLSLNLGNTSVTVTGNEVIDLAKSKPTDKEQLKAQLEKSGGTAFNIVSTQINADDSIFMPISKLNELRRRGISALEAEILRPFNSKRFISKRFDYSPKTNHKIAFSCSVLNYEQYEALQDSDFEYIYMPLNVVLENKGKLTGDRERIVISPPVIIREKERAVQKEKMTTLLNCGFDKAEIHLLDTIDICKGFRLFSGHRLNIASSHACSEAEKLGMESICLSPELNLAQIRDISRFFETEIIAYGKIPLMLCENCIGKNMDMCKCDGTFRFADRTGASFSVAKDGTSCRSVVLNSVPLFAGDKTDELLSSRANRFRLIFTTETCDICKKIADCYINGKNYNIKEFTRLQLFKSTLA